MINLELLNESEPIELELEENSKNGTNNYNELSNKPKINGTELQGNLALEDLGIGTIGDGETYEGLVKLYEGDTNNGLLHWVLSGPRKGCLTVNVATEQSIDKRWNNPIGGNAVDYAVKQAMTDGKGAEWTTEEKASARTRMGLEWKLLGDVTVTEEGVTMIEIPIDNPNYNEYQFYVYVAERITATATNLIVGFNKITSTSYTLSYAGVGTNTTYHLKGHAMRHCNIGWFTNALGSKDGKPCNTAFSKAVDYYARNVDGENRSSETPNSINVSLATGLDIGSRFVVYAR